MNNPNLSIVYLTLDGQPVPLSNGIRIRDEKGRPDQDAEIRIRNFRTGVNAPLRDLGVMPGLGAWDNTRVVAPPLAALRIVPEQAAKGVPLNAISSSEIFWYEDPDGEFVMMNPQRRLVPISPLPVGNYYPVWYPLYMLLLAGSLEAVEEPQMSPTGVATPPVLPYTGRVDPMKILHEEGYLGRGKGGIYACLHPAPRDMLWVYDGHPTIAWDLGTIDGPHDKGRQILARDSQVLEQLR